MILKRQRMVISAYTRSGWRINVGNSYIFNSQIAAYVKIKSALGVIRKRDS